MLAISRLGICLKWNTVGSFMSVLYIIYYPLTKKEASNEQSMWHLWRREREKRCIQDLGGETERRTLGRPRRRWEDNIKINLQEVGLD